MNLETLALIGYGGDAFGSPITLQMLDAALDAAGLKPGDAVLDLGCGCGQVALHLAQRGLQVTAVERWPRVAQAARQRTAGARPGSVVVKTGEALALTNLSPADLVVAIGAGRLAGQAVGAQATLAWLAAKSEPGGAVLWGETFWRRSPSAVLKMVADASGGFGTHAEHQQAGRVAGLSLVHVAESPVDAWDEYVLAYVAAIEDYADTHPDDPDAEPMANRARAWRDLYLAEARDAWGFGLYLFRTPG